ncbi:hypothetical protein L1887_60004 [Cichorium endivia]|nr:hypothetical protein L1887_60004 [Cichorium endivia]
MIPLLSSLRGSQICRSLGSLSSQLHSSSSAQLLVRSTLFLRSILSSASLCRPHNSVVRFTPSSTSLCLSSAQLLTRSTLCSLNVSQRSSFADPSRKSSPHSAARWLNSVFRVALNFAQLRLIAQCG